MSASATASVALEGNEDVVRYFTTKTLVERKVSVFETPRRIPIGNLIAHTDIIVLSLDIKEYIVLVPKA